VSVCLKRGANELHMVQLMPLLPHHLLLHENPDWFNLSGASLPKLSWKRGRYTGVCLQMAFFPELFIPDWTGFLKEKLFR